MNVLIVVTHLLGTGHLSRALTLSRAFRDTGHEVTVASGGMPAPQLGTEGIVQLPALRSDGTDFTRLLTPDGTVAGADYLAARRSRLLELFGETRPDVVICELFPFGRRILADEFLALLRATRAAALPPLVCCSVRDILAPPSRPEKVARADAIVAAFFDIVLVHSDENATRLETSWPVSPGLAERLRYTGFVTPPPAPDHPRKEGEGDILVTAGGGSVGDALYRSALDAARADEHRRWRLLVGGADRQARIAALSRTAPANAIVEPARPDFRQMLRHAAASVSMCGYNTALDLLQAGVPSVLVPFDEGGEVEQGLRAASLARLPGFGVIESAALTADGLLQAIARVQGDPPRDAGNLRFDGAARTVRIVQDLLEARE